MATHTQNAQPSSRQGRLLSVSAEKKRPLNRPLFLLGTLFLLSAGCRPTSLPESTRPLFTLLPADSTGVTFENAVVEDEGFNVLEYEYFYNGAGVAAGDLNNDGLTDLYFTANMSPDHLYLNKGDWTFENSTEAAGLTRESSWTTGVTLVDINDDGWLDLYICRSGRVGADRRRNLLYVNNANPGSGSGQAPTFTERAAEYGLDDPSYSNHASFFDYDRDGDLDLFLLNHSIRRYSNFIADYLRSQRDSLAGDKLFRNEGGVFVDVSEEAGIIGNPLGFGLSAVVTDLNKDGWLDLYVANDYIEDDYLYINQGDGTFKEDVRAYLTHMSYSSMGTDIADVNNDALPDIITLDMLAEGNRRQKLLKGPEDDAFYQDFRKNGYHEQYMRNMLQLNNGNGTFTEIGQLAGVSNTDWSWAALLADYDNDGHKDLFVTNGYMRDYTNLDFLKFTLVNAYQEASRRGEALSSLDMVQQMPSTPIPNYLFRNETGFRFSNQTRSWGLDQASLSNGAAYADLDNDGDLDLIVNNINQPAFLYRNEAERRTNHHYVKIKLAGPPGNGFGIGARVEVQGEGGHVAYQEMIPGRGYLSAVEPILHIGLGEQTRVDLMVTWPDGAQQRLEAVAADQTLLVRHEEALHPEASVPLEETASLLVSVEDRLGLTFTHQENVFNDFEREPLLPHKLSRLGPALAVGDVNQDGLEDLFVGGARGQEAVLFLQQAEGVFQPMRLAAFAAHRKYEDVDAVFLDVDQDRDLDLYVVSGGNDAAGEDSVYQDRIYLNAGFGTLTYAESHLPEMPSSGSCVAPHDFDGDGDLDVFVCGRTLSGRYPYAPRSYLLENTGRRFVDVTAQAGDALMAPGMVTDATWADLDGDGVDELVLAGEWMPLRAFAYQEGGIFHEITERVGLRASNGWWNTIDAGDLDGDGDIDLIAGNTGLNTSLRARPEEPVELYADDFDQNGTLDVLVSAYNHGAPYPINWRDELLAQLPRLATTFPTYASFAEAGIEDVLSQAQRREAYHLQVYETATSLFENQGDGTLQIRSLPVEAQVAPVNAILHHDVTGDGVPDLLLAGNNYATRAQFGRHQAGQGALLEGKGGLDYIPLSAVRHGFYVPGEVQAMAVMETPGRTLVVVANNDGRLQVFAPN